MKKYLMTLPMLFLLITLVIAYSFSMRGFRGSIDFIESDFNLVPYQIKFSVWDNGVKGQGSLQVIGETDRGERVVLIVRFDKNGKGIATYFKQGNGKPERFEVNVNYVYNSITRAATVSGNGGVDFKISRIKTKMINGEIGEPQSECSVDNDCEEDYCEEWSEDYCDEDVYHDRICHDFRCVDGECIEDIYEDIVLVEECLHGCEDGECLAELIEEPEPSPENHDVGLNPDYDGFGHAVRIRGPDPSNDIIGDEVAQLQCNLKYDVQFKTDNLGDFIEDVEINVTIMNSTDIIYNDIKLKEDLAVGGGCTNGNKNNFNMSFDAGFYTISVESLIVGFDDVNVLDNSAQRQIEIIC